MKLLDRDGLSRFLNKIKTIIPTKTSDITNDSGYLDTAGVQNYMEEGGGYSQSYIDTALSGKADSSHTHTKSEITDFPTLATVATSGSYNDLSNTPTIPTVYNKTLTIQKNGTTVNTFTANSASDVTANITVPTAVSELTNDSGYLTSASNLDSSKLTGTIDIARLPKGALERLVTVANQTARYALTTSDVQLGDTVKQLDTGVMYIVTDETKLSSADGYTEYTAGSATSVPWSGVSGKPSSFAPSSHTHGNVTNDGKLPTASRALISDSSKNITVSSVSDTELGYLSGVTSAIQTQINGKADDTRVVHKTGNETISGTKTFSNSTNVDLSIQKGISSGSCNIRFNDDTGLSRTVIRSYNDMLEIGHLRNANWYDGAEFILKDDGSSKIKSNNGTTSVEVSFNPDSVKPTNSVIDLGTSSNKWKSVYADSYYLGTTAFGDIATHNASEFSASNHVHGNITNDGKVGTTANKPLITGTGGVVQTGSFGTAANTFCEGNDSRLSDARTPVAHTHLTSDVTDLLSGNHTWTSQQSYSSDLNLNYASTDVDDIVNSVAGSATLDNFVHMTGNETVNGIKSFPDGIVANVTGSATSATNDGSGNVISTTYGKLGANNAWTGLNTFVPSNLTVNTGYALGTLPQIEDAQAILRGNTEDGNFNALVSTYQNATNGTGLRFTVRNKYTSGQLTPSGTSKNSHFHFLKSLDGTGYLWWEGYTGNSIYPLTDSAYDLGTSANQWKSVYAQNYYYNGVAWGLDKSNVWSASNTYLGTVNIYNSDNTQTTPELSLRNSKTEVSSSGNTAGSQGIYFADKNGRTITYVGGMVQSNGCSLRFRTFTKDESNNTVESAVQIASFTSGSKWLAPSEDNAIDLGGSSYRWKSFNGVNPGALSFPDYDNAAKIDISGSITPDQNGNIFYTPTINGWLYVCYDMSNATTNDSIFYIQAKDNNVANSNFVQTERIPTSWSTSSLSIIFPVVANKQFIMQINFSNYTIIKAHIIPCLGNV